MVSNDIEEVVEKIKGMSLDVPVILFPGDYSQLTDKADAMLLLNLTSGRNAEYLIGQHVRAALRIAKSGLEVIPTGYILIDGGRATSVEYVSGTRPIPSDKPELAVATALAGELLGLKATYLEAGSGAERAVAVDTIKAVRAATEGILIVGGGIRSAEGVEAAYRAGADIVVVGTAIEKNPEIAELILEVVERQNNEISRRM